MKTPNPLAAALLLMAASVSAQPFASGTGTSYNFGGQNASPFSFGAASGPVDDIVFNCGTVPYIACTAEHMNKRENIRITGVCPAPASAACTQYLMSTRGAANPIETIAAYDPPPGRQWASPDCQRIPCRLADPVVLDDRRLPATQGSGPSGIENLGNLPYDQQPGFIGPPMPPGPQPFTDEDSFRQAMREQAKLTPGKVVDLGNNTYAVDIGDGNYSIGGLCSGSPCSGLPKPADQIPGLADALQAATSLNSGGGSINKENPNPFGPTSTPPGGSGRSSQGADTPPPADVARTEAKASGGDAGNFFRNNGGGKGASAGGTSGDSYTAAAADGNAEAIATEAAELDGVFTYIKTQEIKAAIDRTAGAVTTGGDGTFVTPNTTPDANAGDLQFKGTQSGANR